MADSRDSFIVFSLSNKSKRFKPVSTISEDKDFIWFISCFLEVKSNSVEYSNSSLEPTDLLALYKISATFNSSCTAYPSEEYTFFKFSLTLRFI